MLSTFYYILSILLLVNDISRSVILYYIYITYNKILFRSYEFSNISIRTNNFSISLLGIRTNNFSYSRHSKI